MSQVNDFERYSYWLFLGLFGLFSPQKRSLSFSEATCMMLSTKAMDAVITVTKATIIIANILKIKSKISILKAFFE